LYGFDGCIGALYERKDGMFTGKKLRHIPGNKATLLRAYAQENNLAFTDSIAAGDSAGDIPMLEIVEQPIAFNPSHDLMEHAKKQGWRIVLERKNVAYELRKGQDGYILEKTDHL
jgi:phosphoserine phosphatase